jgi:hypothetical protein
VSEKADKSAAKEAKNVDWELIERDYRAGVLSVREIAASQGISHAAINKRAKRDGWERDLQARIQAKADALVSKREVSKLVTTERLVTEKAIVEGNAMRIADVRMSHRSDIARMRRLVISMLEELEIETADISLFKELGDLLRSEDDKGQDKRNDLYQKVISSSQRIDSMKKLAETLKILITVEREAYGITDGGEKEDDAKVINARYVIVPQKQVAVVETRQLAKVD